MITIKTKEEIEILREGGRRHAIILQKISEKIVPGVSTDKLDLYARKLLKEGGDKAAFLNYTPRGAERAYPAALCVSVNDEIVHGIPNEKPKILKDGDIVSIDLGLEHDGLITDAAITVLVGQVSDELRKLSLHTKEALYRGIKAACGGKNIGDIGFAISSFGRKLGYGIPEDLAGHGVGYKVHEEPYVPNFGKKGKGDVLSPGMVIAIEPMFTLGGDKIRLSKDGYTYHTKDHSMAAHWEHTIAITDGEPIILTKVN